MEAKGKVILIRRIRGDWPIGHNVIAEPGVYTAFCNPHGAVSVQVENSETGELEYLGLKPGEFEWLSKEGESPAHPEQ